MADLFKKMKSVFRGKKGKRDQDSDQSSVFERYGVREEAFQENPLFEPNSENEAYNPLYGMDLDKEQDSEEPLQEGNLIENIGGLPSIASIEKMAGGLKWDKIRKHKNFALALDALDRYQVIMRKPHSLTLDTAKVRHTGHTTSKDANLDMDDTGALGVASAFDAMKEFVLYADHAVNGIGLFSRNSSNVQKLKPVFANLLVRAYGILPKLAYLENEIAPYLITTDQETYTYEDVLNHQITAGRSEGYAMKGSDADNGAFALKPKEALKALKSKTPDAKIVDLRKQATIQSHLKMMIPPLPIGAEDAEEAAERYIEHIKILMRALDDTAESYEGGGAENDRLEIHGKQAEHFWLSKLFYRGIQNKELLTAIIKNGIPENMTQEEENVAVLAGYSGMTLSQGLAKINQEARDTTKFQRLVDKSGNALAEVESGTNGYKVGGGSASIAILDHVNKKVLRAPKKNKKYLSEDEQNKAINGIHDEAIAKVGQFLGFHVIANAEAAGFMAKEKGEAKEAAVFGGSIMDMVEGKTASEMNYLLKDGSGANDINVLKNGRLINEMLQMNVIDFLMAHADRHFGNFLINKEAKQGDSIVTGIDNDMILGNGGSDNERIGFQSSKEALLGIKNRSELSYAVKLHGSFPMMPQNIKDAIHRMDISKLNELLMPYADRVVRLGVLRRAMELKEYAKDVKVCDFETEEGIREYLKESGKISLIDAVKRGQINAKGFRVDSMQLSNLIVRVLLLSNVKSAHFFDEKKLISYCKMFGMTKEEVTEILRKNISTSNEDDVSIDDEEFKKTEIWKWLERYDSLKPEELAFVDSKMPML